MRKSLAFGAMHVGVAFSVGYALTGSVSVAGAITIVEPVCNTIAHYFFDRWWDRREKTSARPDEVDSSVQAARTTLRPPEPRARVTPPATVAQWPVPAV